MADEEESVEQMPPMPAYNHPLLDSNLPIQKDSQGRQNLRSWLNKFFRIKMTDGRILIGYFLCTDRDGNIILGMSSEFRDENERNLGLIIVAKKHIVSIEVDTSSDKHDIN